MKIINIVDSVSSINYGLWHSTIINAQLLANEGHSIELWYPGMQKLEIPDVECVPLASTKITFLIRLINEKSFNCDNTIVITNGVWQYATRWGSYLKSLGYRWIYVPHGMLEPWPLQQKWLKKKLYYFFIESRLAQKADLIRAVSVPELNNLKKRFPASNIQFIPNSVHVGKFINLEILNPLNKKRFLFLSRLHHKKNIKGLIQAWQASSLNNNPMAELVIAGPDQGELKLIDKAKSGSSNLSYAGTVFGAEKKTLFESATFFILPSFSEGLPSSLLEAMGYGLIPLITTGCNLPEVFDLDLGIKISTDQRGIMEGIEKAFSWDNQLLVQKSRANYDFILANYSVETLTKTQKKFYFSNI